MWQLVKSEFRYNWYTYTLLSIMLGLYTIFSLVDFQQFTSKKTNTDLWGGLYSFVILVFTLSVWGQRFKEKRNRYFATLPLTTKQLAISRFLFAVIPFTVVVIYLIVVHLVVMNSWHCESNSLLIQIGVMLVLFAGFIRARDDWFSHWNFGKRIQAAFISVLIIQILVVAIFLNPPDSYRQLLPIVGDYTEIIFFLLGLVIMITTIFSYQKRKSYLS